MFGLLSTLSPVVRSQYIFLQHFLRLSSDDAPSEVVYVRCTSTDMWIDAEYTDIGASPDHTHRLIRITLLLPSPGAGAGDEPAARAAAENLRWSLATL